MKNPRRGVTLIEILVAMTVVSFVLLAVLNVLTFSKRSWNNQVGRAGAIAEANLAVELMAKEIGSAVSVQNDSGGSPTIFILPADTDAAGNYVPAGSGAALAYGSGTPVQFYLSNTTGAAGLASGGTTLWRQTASSTVSGGLLGTGLLNTTTTTWTPDAAWSKAPGGQRGRFPDVSALAFKTAGLPANTVQVSVTVSIKEGGQTSRYTVTRNVYLANHN